MAPRTGRLLFRIYLGCLLTVMAAVALSFVFINRLSDGGEPDRSHFSRQLLTDLVRLRGQPERLSGEVALLKKYSRLHASLYGTDGTLLASTVEPPLAMLSAVEQKQLIDHNPLRLSRGLSAHAFFEQGQLIAVGLVSHRSPPLRGPFVAVGCFLVLLIFTAVVFARQLGKPLQQIAHTAERFGHGELGARTGIRRSDEIGTTAQAFDAMADRVTLLMTAQQELLANVSHELRTPLARMHVAVDLIVDGVEGEARELLPEITRDLGELERLIDDVMVVARLDLAQAADRRAGTPLRLLPISVTELIHTAESRFRSAHKSHHLVVEIAPDLPILQADAVLLRRVLENLLDNARKYSEPGGTITVSAESRDGGVRLSVSDAGIGIDIADQQRVFAPFFRSDRSRSRATGGVGLGLALARRVVEAHDGTIALTSELGRGTTVTMDLPSAQVAALRHSSS